MRKIILVLSVGLVLISLVSAQNPAGKTAQAPAGQPANELASALAARLGNDLHVKTVIGEPIKVGSVTLIPIMMIDVAFGGGAMTPPANPAAPQSPAAGAPSKPAMGVDGFSMNGEARPLGFVAVSKKGTRFISVGKTPAK